MKTRNYIFIFILMLGMAHYGGRLAAKSGLLSPVPADLPEQNRENNGISRFGDRQAISHEELTKESDKQHYARKVARMTSEERIAELARLRGMLGKENETLLYILFEEWGKTSPRELLIELKKIGGNFYKNHVNWVIQYWASRNPEAAAAYYLENRESLVGSSICPFIIGQWTRLDPEAAWKWMNARESEEQNNSLMQFLFRLPQEKIGDFIRRFSDTHWERHSLISTVLHLWSYRNPDEMERFMDHLSPDKKKLIAGDMFQNYCRDNDQDKASKYLSLLEPSDIRNVYISSEILFPSNFGMEEMAWLQKQLPEDYFDHLIKEGEIVFSSLDNCLSWAKKEQSVSRRDNMISAFIEKDASPDYTGVMNMIEMVYDATGRDRLKEQNLKNWANRDMEGARKWLETSSLSRDRKKELEGMINELVIKK